nr:MAG TPA: Interleukin-22-22 (IL-22), interleukin-10 (IL-10), interferon-gamma.0A [Caudoviricetes sp.]
MINDSICWLYPKVENQYKKKGKTSHGIYYAFAKIDILLI